jgi:G-protein alpha subunit
MIMTRVRTNGIVVTEVKEAPFTYQVVDVGGQRSERRKWIHCFDDVRAIIFLEGLAGYNQGKRRKEISEEKKEASEEWKGRREQMNGLGEMRR